MGVAAPIPKAEAALILATEAVKGAIDGDGNVFDVPPTSEYISVVSKIQCRD
jgi:hypothetical protein